MKGEKGKSLNMEREYNSTENIFLKLLHILQRHGSALRQGFGNHPRLNRAETEPGSNGARYSPLEL